MSKSLLDDDLNRQIIACLQQEGRISHAELAERLAVSRPTVIDRVRRLENEGIIEGYHALVSPAAVQKATVAYVLVRCRTDDSQMEQRYIEDLSREPDIIEAHTTAGEDCLLIKIVADTPRGVNELLRRVRAMGPYASTRTTMVLETHFVKPGPSPYPSVPSDA